MKNMATLIDASDELSRAGVLGLLAGSRYKAIGIKEGWDALVAAGKPIPQIVILVLSGAIEDVAAVTNKIEAVARRSKVVVLGDVSDPNLVRRALRARGSAFLPCSVGAETLIQALNLALVDEIVIPSQIVGEVFACRELDAQPKGPDVSETVTAQRPGNLSLREIDILKRLVHGESNKQISRRLDISETTVKVHVKAILRKIRLRNRTQAAIWGLDHLPDALSADTDVPDAPSLQRLLTTTEYPAAA
jgi:two-component system nitrate/nitrite response regulator NarL